MIAPPYSRLSPGRTLPPQQVGHHLHAVADAQDRDPQIEEGRVAQRGAFVGHAGRSAGEDDALGLRAAEVRGPGVEAQQFAVHVLFADAPGDELAVLRAEIQDGDPVVRWS